MARKRRDTKLDTRAARAKEKARREPYWTQIVRGRYLGYRKGAKGGTWIARYRDPETGQQRYQSLGASDDFEDANGTSILTFDQAVGKAREWFEQEALRSGEEVPSGPYTRKGTGLAVGSSDFGLAPRGAGFRGARGFPNFRFPRRRLGGTGR